MILEAFAKTFVDKAYQFTTMVSHKGVLIAFAMDSERHIYYSVLNLRSSAGGTVCRIIQRLPRRSIKMPGRIRPS
jgi:hypothetical protein